MMSEWAKVTHQIFFVMKSVERLRSFLSLEKKNNFASRGPFSAIV